MNAPNENQKTTEKPVTTNSPVRPNLADSSINQQTQDLENTPNEHDPEKEYIAGEQEGDFPPDIKMHKNTSSLNEGSEYDTDQGTVGQQSIKDHDEAQAKNSPQSKH